MPQTAAPAPAPETQPDLVLVMADQQRFDQAGFGGDPQFDTPHLDRLAADGVVFEHAYSTGTTCIPGRVGLLTGVQPHRVPTGADGMSPREGIWTLARGLRDAGYQTALVGKMHLLPIHAEQGFDEMRMCEHPDALSPGRAVDDVDDYRRFLLGEGLVDWRDLPPVIALDDDQAVWGGQRPIFPFDPYYHPTEWIVRETADVVAHRDRTRPLFLVVSFLHPHAPYNPPEPFVGRFDPADAVLPRDGFEVNDGLPPAFVAALTSTRGPYVAARFPAHRPFAQRFVTLMRAMVAHVDDAVGRVLAGFDRSTSVVAYTSDHGDFGGHRGLVRKVPWIPFDDLARVPLVVRAPTASRGARLVDPVQSSDLALTLLDYAGVEPPPLDTDSRSLRPAVDQGPAASDGDRAVFCGLSQGWPMIRHGRSKLIVNGDQRVLFDLADDPGERVDRSADARARSVRDELVDGLRTELYRPPVPLVDGID
jgi:arylsulfatase A-like enzyme